MITPPDDNNSRFSLLRFCREHPFVAFLTVFFIMMLMAFTPGSYTIQVTDYSGKGGQVLIEVYASPTYVLSGG